MQSHDLGDLLADGQQRIQAAHRFLEDHADLVAADPSHVRLRQQQQVPAAKQHASAGNLPRRCRHQPHDGQRGHRLAAAGLAHDRQRLAGDNREADAIHRARDRAVGVEQGSQVLNLEQRRVRSCQPAQPWIERIAQSVAHRLQRKHRQDNAKSRRKDQPIGILHVLLCRGDHVAPGRTGRRHAGAEEGQRRLGQNGEGEHERALHQQRRQQVRQQVHDDDAPVAGAERLRRLDELQLAQHQVAPRATRATRGV